MTALLAYYRTGGADTPPDGEVVELFDDGRLSGWRGRATAVGRFSGTVADDTLARLRELADGVGGLPGPLGAPVPGAANETLVVRGGDPVDVAAVVDDDPGAWGLLVAAARDLLDRLVGYPLAAVRLAVDDDGAALEHIGTEPIVVDLASAELGIARWRGWYEPVGSRVDPVGGPERVTAEPGWRHPLAVGDPAPEDDVTVHLTLTFAAVVNDTVVPVRLAHEPIPGRPPD